MLKKMRESLQRKKGSGIFQFIIILAIVAILAVTALPSLNEKISEKTNGAIDRIDNMDSALDE
jgi:competence protein ComGC